MDPQVLVFSSMAPLHGRILQAVYDGITINIWKTGIFDFKTPEREQNFQIFLQHLTNEPIGNTKDLPVVESLEHLSRQR